MEYIQTWPQAAVSIAGILGFCFCVFCYFGSR